MPTKITILVTAKASPGDGGAPNSRAECSSSGGLANEARLLLGLGAGGKRGPPDDQGGSRVVAAKKTKRACSDSDCDKQAKKEGLCTRHYKEKFGVNAYSCSHEDCSKQVQKRGLCARHYREEFGTSVPHKECSLVICHKQARKMGLCGRHYTEKFGGSCNKSERMQR